MKEFLENLQPWWPAILIIGQLAIGWGNWRLSKRFATKEELNAVKDKAKKHGERLVDIEGKVTVIESDLRHMPTSKDLCKLQQTIAGLAQLCKTLNTSTKRIDDFLMRQP